MPEVTTATTLTPTSGDWLMMWRPGPTLGKYAVNADIAAFLADVTSPSFNLVTANSLAGVSSIDATTEATFEAAIDSLLNLSEVGNISTGTWSAAFGDTLLQDLADIAGTATAADQVLVSTGVGTFALESGATLRTSLGLGTGDTPTFTALTLGTGVDANQTILTLNVTGSPALSWDETNDRFTLNKSLQGASFYAWGGLVELADATGTNGTWFAVDGTGDLNLNGNGTAAEFQISSLDLHMANGQIVSKTIYDVHLHSANDVVAELGDAAGVKKLSIRDSAAAEVAFINSEGAMTLNVPANAGIVLELNGAQMGGVGGLEMEDASSMYWGGASITHNGASPNRGITLQPEGTGTVSIFADTYIGGYLQVSGGTGIRAKDSSGVFDVRDNGDTAQAKVRLLGVEFGANATDPFFKNNSGVVELRDVQDANDKNFKAGQATFTRAILSSANCLNITETGTAPSTPATGDIYLDDGTNWNSGGGVPGFRRYTGAAWEDIGNDGGGGGGSLASLSDVTLTTPATGATLIYNGSVWVDGQLDLADPDAVTGVLPSANLDADTMHLSVGQVVTGTKTFNDGHFLLNNTTNTFTAELSHAATTDIVITLPSISETLVGRTTTDTLTNKTLTSPVLNGSLSGTAFLDEDTMSSNSATAVASQQSIKAYVDNQIAANAATEETSIWVDAGAMVPEDGAAGPTAAVVAGGTSGGDIDVLLFAEGEKAYFRWTPPTQYDGGDVSVEVLWAPASGATTGHKCKWGIAALAIANDEDWDGTAFPTPDEQEDVVLGTDDLHSIEITGVTTSWNDGETILFELERTTAAATSMAQDARLWGVRVKYNNTARLEVLGFACSDETTVISSTGERVAVDMPYNFTVTRVYGSLKAAGTTTDFKVDVQDEGVTIFNVADALVFSSGSNNAEVNGVFASAATSYALTKGDLLTIDVGALDSGGTAAGLKVFLEGYRT